jgi:hypothetical protein
MPNTYFHKLCSFRNRLDGIVTLCVYLRTCYLTSPQKYKPAILKINAVHPMFVFSLWSRLQCFYTWELEEYCRFLDLSWYSSCLRNLFPVILSSLYVKSPWANFWEPRVWNNWNSGCVGYILRHLKLVYKLPNNGTRKMFVTWITPWFSCFFNTERNQFLTHKYIS